MRRPLLAVCICIVTVIAVFMRGGGDSSSPAILQEGVNLLQDGSLVTVTGKVYRKDFKYFYLNLYLDFYDLNLGAHSSVRLSSFPHHFTPVLRGWR